MNAHLHGDFGWSLVPVKSSLPSQRRITGQLLEIPLNKSNNPPNIPPSRSLKQILVPQLIEPLEYVHIQLLGSDVLSPYLVALFALLLLKGFFMPLLLFLFNYVPFDQQEVLVFVGVVQNLLFVQSYLVLLGIGMEPLFEDYLSLTLWVIPRHKFNIFLDVR